MNTPVAQHPFKKGFIAAFTITFDMLPFTDKEMKLYDQKLTQFEQFFLNPDIEKYQNGCGGCDVCLGMSNSKMILDNTKTTKRLKNINEITGTVAQSVDFYQKGFSLDQIAKIRELGVRTIWNHLIEWYAVGGDFRVEEYISKDQRQRILAVIDELGDYSKLRPIKDLLPENISYEQIKIVIAKIEQEKNVIIKIT